MKRCTVLILAAGPDASPRMPDDPRRAEKGAALRVDDPPEGRSIFPRTGANGPDGDPDDTPTTRHGFATHPVNRKSTASP